MTVRLPSDFFSIVAPMLKEEPEICESKSIGLMAHLMSPPIGLVMITGRSPKRYKVAVETLAWCFKREFGYDCPGYTADEITSDDAVRSFLWTEEDRRGYRVIGACTFRVRDYPNLPKAYWTLCWIWIHPFRRGRGLLNMAWPFFTEMFQPLDVEPPISPAMEQFLEDKPYQIVHTNDEKRLPIKLYISKGD